MLYVVHSSYCLSFNYPRIRNVFWFLIIFNKSLLKGRSLCFFSLFLAFFNVLLEVFIRILKLRLFFENYTITIARIIRQDTSETISKYDEYMHTDTYDGVDGWAVTISGRFTDIFSLNKITYISNLSRISELFPFIILNDPINVAFSLGITGKIDLDKPISSVDGLILEIKNDINT